MYVKMLKDMLIPEDRMTLSRTLTLGHMPGWAGRRRARVLSSAAVRLTRNPSIAESLRSLPNPNPINHPHFHFHVHRRGCLQQFLLQAPISFQDSKLECPAAIHFLHPRIETIAPVRHEDSARVHVGAGDDDRALTATAGAPAAPVARLSVGSTRCHNAECRGGRQGHQKVRSACGQSRAPKSTPRRPPAVTVAAPQKIEAGGHTQACCLLKKNWRHSSIKEVPAAVGILRGG